MTQPSNEQTETLQAAAGKRFKLKAAVVRAEIAAAAPSDREDWRLRLLDELEELRSALIDHITEVEADGGLLDEILARAPRLASQIGIARDEHHELRRQINQLIDEVQANADTSVAQSRVLDALAAIAHHRRRSSDLVYNGYNVDIGGS